MPALRFRVPVDAHLAWRRWDDEHLVYHVESGDTHRLSAVGASALQHLRDGPLDARELAGRLASPAQLTPDAAVLDTVERLLADLCDVGLVEPADDVA